ncbi:MAG: hypothetical protein ACOX2F_08555 [bacterium]
MRRIKIKELVVFILLMFIFSFAMAHDKSYDYESELIKIMENSGLEHEIVFNEKEIEKIAENKALPNYYYTDLEEFREMIEQQSQASKNFTFVAIVYQFLCLRLINYPPPFTPNPGDFSCLWRVSDPYNEVDGYKFYIKDNYSSTVYPNPPAYTTDLDYWGTQPYQSVWTAYLQMYKNSLIWLPSPLGGHWVLIRVYDDKVYTTRAYGFW